MIKEDQESKLIKMRLWSLRGWLRWKTSQELIESYMNSHNHSIIVSDVLTYGDVELEKRAVCTAPTFAWPCSWEPSVYYIYGATLLLGISYWLFLELIASSYRCQLHVGWRSCTEKSTHRCPFSLILVAFLEVGISNNFYFSFVLETFK